MRFATRPIPPLEDPLGRDPDLVWMSPRVSLWGWGEAARLHPGAGPDRFEALRSQLSEMMARARVEDRIGRAGTGPVAFVSLTFAPGSVGSVAVVPRVVVGRDPEGWWITAPEEEGLPDPGPDDPGIPDRARYAGSSVPDLLWLEAVAMALTHIESGDVEKVVLARDYAVWSRRPFHRRRLLRHLHGRFPSCHVFQIADLVGASPELLVRRRDGRLESLVLAGSAPVYQDPEADRAAAAALLDSAKDRWEHELAVRSVRRSLEEVGISVAADPQPGVLRLDNVRHLATSITARSPDGFDALDAAARLHPTAAVGGTPTPAALELISRLEGMDRGRYAGPVGWTDRNGDGELAIALRCAELSGARARLFAGAGIVRGSLPEAELEETRLKLGAMMGALGV
ncbi:MAG: isochorismate synthase MenF [Actinomycetota bacterium]